MLKDTVAFAKHIEDMMRDTLGVSKEESVEEEDELPEEVGVTVLRQLVEDEPVSHLTLGEHVLEALLDVLVVLVAHLTPNINLSLRRFNPPS